MGGDEDTSDPIEGTYETSKHTLAPDCENAMEVSEPCEDCRLDDEHFKLKMVTFFGHTGLVYVACKADGSCDDDDEEPGELSFNLGGPAFEGKVDGAWVGTAKFAGGIGDTCSYGETEYKAEMTEEGARLTVSSFDKKEIELPESMRCKEGENGIDNDCGCGELIDNPPARSELTCEYVEVREAKLKE